MQWPGAQEGRNKSLLHSAAGRALQRNDVHSLHIDITWDPEKLQAFVQVNHAAVGLLPHPSVHCGIFKADDCWRHCILESNRLTDAACVNHHSCEVCHSTVATSTV
mgnify:CR=1 FL=1